MSFKTSDFKKTTRTLAGERVLYPYQIKDDRYTASISYAITYYERMVGRRRAEFESETLLEFFGDARLARGLVACLARTYSWRAQTFAEAFGEACTQTLWRAQITSSAALRAQLHELANHAYGGVVLPHERGDILAVLCKQINSVSNPIAQAALTPELLEQALFLDAEEQHVLLKHGSTPEPHEIIALYNYHSLETALCHAEKLQLQLRGPVWNIIRSIHNLARRYRLRYELSGAPRTLFDERIELTIHGGRDVFGSWTRTGRRVVRTLLRLLASHPDSLAGGTAYVHIKGQILNCKLDERALAVLGVAARRDPELSESWEEDSAELFQKAWSRAFVRGQTAGWRLRRDPEPLIGTGAVVVPDFALQRGRERLALCLTIGQSSSVALVRDLNKLGSRTQALAVMPARAAESLRSCPIPLATYEQQPSEAITTLVTTLERRYPRRAFEQNQTPWQRLERLVAEEGFVEEQTVAHLMNCTPEEAARLVQRWGGPALHVLPGLGVCTPDTLGEIRQLIEAGELTARAA